MAWPSTRLTTYNPATKVKSADLNAIQDAIIKLNTKTIIIPGLSFVATRTANGLSTPAKYSIIGVGAGEIQNDTTTATVNDFDVLAPIEGVPTNATILTARFYLRDHATGPAKWECHVYRASIYGGAVTEPVAFQLSSGAGTDQTITFAGLNISTAGGGVKSFLRARQSGGTAANPIKIYGCEVDVYTP